MNSCLIIDSARFGVHVNTEGVIAMNSCEITGSGETGLFAGGVGSATIMVFDSEITNNGNGAGANPGGNLRLSNTLVEGNQSSGVFAIGGQVVIDGASRIAGNGTGVILGLGSVAHLQPGPVVVESNLSDGITIRGGSNLNGGDAIVRNNGNNGILAQDLSTVSFSSPAQITDNGRWGISCAGPPAIAVLGGQGLFNPSVIDLSGNALGDTNCQ